MLIVEVTRVDGYELDLPRYETSGAAGMDLRAAAETYIESGERALVPTGIALAIPPGYEGQIRPRSGLAKKQGLTVLNSPGTIDSDYRGEVKVLLINLGHGPVQIHPGDRIAQIVFATVERVSLVEVRELGYTQRGDGGFGSTGK